MTLEEARAKLQRRLIVTDSPPLDLLLVDTIASLLMDVDHEAFERGLTERAHEGD